MATNLIDAVNDKQSMFYRSFWRLLMETLMRLLKERANAAMINEQLRAVTEFKNEFEKFYDSKNERVRPGVDKIPFNVCSCKSFAERKIVQALKDGGVNAILLEDGEKHFLVVPEKDMRQFEKIVSDITYQNAKTTMLNVSKFNQTFNRRVRYTDVSETKLEAFKEFAQDKKFPYAVHVCENGKYEIYVPKSVADDASIGVDNKMKEINILYSYGISAERQNFNAQRKAQEIETLLESSKDFAQGRFSGKEIYADAKNPGTYVVLEGEQVSIFSAGKNIGTVYQPVDVNTLLIKMNNVGYDMSQMIKIPPEKHHMFAEGKVKPEDRINFANEIRLSTEFFTNQYLFKKIEDTIEKNGSSLDVKQLLVEDMKKQLELAQDETSKQLLSQLQDKGVSSEQLQVMLNTGSSIDAGIVKTPELADKFDETFKASLENLILFQTSNEEVMRDKMDGHDLDNITAEIVEKYQNINGIDSPFISVSAIMTRDILNNMKHERSTIDDGRRIEELSNYRDEQSIDDVINQSIEYFQQKDDRETISTDDKEL